jgi:2-polyprenyl-3-methyl-5-hydroxy-6-metoxy-1,4-benzoquinol methylase
MNVQEVTQTNHGSPNDSLAETSDPCLSPTFRLSDLWKAPVHDFPIRDEVVYQFAALHPAMKILEIGPGSGFTGFRLARQLRAITMVDIAAQNVERLRHDLKDLNNVSVLCADVCTPGLRERVGGHYDAVHGIEIFELLPEPGTCLSNLATVLRPGGYVMLQFPNYPPPKNPGMTYFQTRRELDELLRTAGFVRWDVYALRLRPHAEFLYSLTHERPLKLYRRLRDRNRAKRAITYDESWTFRRGNTLNSCKFIMHLAWTVLFGFYRLGGCCFRRTLLGDEILNHNLLLIAYK